MTEIKNENKHDIVEQLGKYKTNKLQGLNVKISREKSRAAILLSTIRAKREDMIASVEELHKEPAPTETTVETAPVNEPTANVEVKQEEKAAITPSIDVSVENAVTNEDKKPEPEAAVTDTEKNADIVKSDEAAEKTTEKPEKKASVETKTEKPNNAAKNVNKTGPEKTGNKETSVKNDKKQEAKPIRRTTDNENIQEEILPNGEVRRIYVPPTPVVKPKVQTRVFGQNGYQNNRSPRPQGAPGTGYQGNRPFNRDGNNAPRPPRPGFGAEIAPSPIIAQKPGLKKGPAKPGNSNAKFDDKGSLNKRALMKKGYIIDSTITSENYEDARIRGYKPGKNRAIAFNGTIVIDNAVITTDPVSIKVLSEKIGKTAAEIIKTLFFLGIQKTINESIDFTTAELVAGEHNITLEYKPDVTMEDTLTAKHVFDDEDDISKLSARPPIITIMGHVDHGKTSLLDYIRKAHVTSGEAGGITQHIGAYTVSLKGSPITFLDTPGHEAFTSMRARGAQVTDISVLVVAADDGIMPQTIEAINHSKQAKVPVIVAVNKMDKPAADPDRILHQLSEHEILPEEWGGDTPVVRVSAKTGQGVDELLETILTMAELRELKANENRNARGTIIEARLDKGLGKIATILVQNGTLHIGDNVVAGTCTGKIRAMIDDKGKNVKKAGPSIPVSVIGWDEVPEAGDLIDVVSDEKFARNLAEERRIKLSQNNNDSASVSLADLFDKIKKGELKSVKLIIKADVQGSLEAVKQSLSKLGNEEVDIDIIHGGVGAIKESDVTLADTAKAIIIGFNVRPDVNAKLLAAQKKIDIRFYDIIYNAIEDIEKAVKGLLDPKFNEVVLGGAEVREVFKISGVGAIAGCHVTDGKVVRGVKCRLVRDGKVEYTGEIASLRHGKEDVKEMAKNFDCGIMLSNYNDVKQGDYIEAFQMEQVNED